MKVALVLLGLIGAIAAFSQDKNVEVNASDTFANVVKDNPEKQSIIAKILGGISVVPSSIDHGPEAARLFERLCKVFEKHPELNLNRDTYVALEKEYGIVKTEDQYRIRKAFLLKLDSLGYTI